MRPDLPHPNCMNRSRLRTKPRLKKNDGNKTGKMKSSSSNKRAEMR